MHQPVLLKEVLEIFNPRPGQIYIDATINGGGHALAILERVKARGKVLGVDWDSELIKILEEKKKRLGIKNLFLECENYINIREIAAKQKFKKVDGILFDLGFSSYHIEESGRGFSFLKGEPLDMRYSINDNEFTAEKIVNHWPEDAIAYALREYGEERFAKRIARAIVHERRHRKISSAVELGQIIKQAIPYRHLRNQRGLHPATRTFQALRIAVNNELENLRGGLKNSLPLIKIGGKLVVISFHSLEDRAVKTFLKDKEKEGRLIQLTKKPLIVSAQELKENPRARSAKLRVAIIKNL